MRVVTASQMREIDRRTMEERGIPARDLMEQAAQCLTRAVIDLIDGSNLLVLCGSGNNGGDGFCCARQLAEMGYAVSVVPVFGSEKLAPEARSAWEALLRSKARIVPFFGIESLDPLLDEVDGVVDAMLGTGIALPLRDPLPGIIERVVASGLPVVAADIPTGLDADSGTGEQVLTAHCTVTFGLPKLGMLTPNGVRHCGHVRVEHLQFPHDLLEDISLNHKTLTLPMARRLLPRRPLDGHKGTFGRVGILAGSAGMPGAAVLCGMGALRGGAGLVRMMVPPAIRGVVQLALPEALHPEVAYDATGVVGGISHPEGEEGWAKCNALVLGPGTGDGVGVGELLAEVLSQFPGPMVVDADALNALASSKSLRERLTPKVILTPHPGELARLLDCTTREIESDRWGAARRAAGQYGCPVLLKGFGSLVAAPGGEVTHIPSGNTALARGGSGDLLSGVIGALLAQGTPPAEAAMLGSFVCGLAADILVREQSPRGLTVRDVAGALGLAFREIEQAPR